MPEASEIASLNLELERQPAGAPNNLDVLLWQRCSVFFLIGDSPSVFLELWLAAPTKGKTDPVLGEGVGGTNRFDPDRLRVGEHGVGHGGVSCGMSVVSCDWSSEICLRRSSCFLRSWSALLVDESMVVQRARS